MATEPDWRSAARDLLETEEDFRKALSGLRNAVERKRIKQLREALQRFQAAGSATFPTTVEQLAAYFDPPLDPALLSRWRVMPPVKLDGVEGPPRIMQMPVDREFDHIWILGPHGYNSGGVSPGPGMEQMWKEVEQPDLSPQEGK